MKITTSRFGEVEIEEQAVIQMPGGLIGFPSEERYIIIQHSPDSPFYWYQAVDNPDLAFVIVDPLVFNPDYKVPLNKPLLEALGTEDKSEVGIYVIVTIPQGDPKGMTANLLGPLAINTRTRTARQLILDEKKYSHRHPIMAGAEDQTCEK